MNEVRIGIMGGTFDPIHNGHLKMVSAIVDSLRLSQVLFIPAYVAPHKVGGQFAAAEHRYAMVELAVAGHPNYQVSDMELRRQGVSYTVDTVRTLRDLYGAEAELFFLIGADSVPCLHTWHNIYELLTLCRFAAAARPGFCYAGDVVAHTLGSQYVERVVWVPTPEIDISSTQVRQLIAAARSIDTLVPFAVAEYIERKNLYRR